MDTGETPGVKRHYVKSATCSRPARRTGLCRLKRARVSMVAGVLDSLAPLQKVIKLRMGRDYYEIIHSRHNGNTRASLSAFDFTIIS